MAVQSGASRAPNSRRAALRESTSALVSAFRFGLVSEIGKGVVVKASFGRIRAMGEGQFIARV